MLEVIKEGVKFLNILLLYFYFTDRVGIFFLKSKASIQKMK